MPDTRKMANEISKKFLDEGKLIEAGFAAMQLTVMAPDAPPDQVREMRMAFFAGAQHLFGTIMNVLDEDAEPTAADLRRMDLIHQELDTFIKEVSARLPTKGRA
jgi:hypothetical protein